ncbi:TMEM43 family protein [Agrilutibacter niabensis]|uniref:TMEM43 family protein n=1 Tax=Agrilutibacter niabensis TaxID=380628 RepID=UPI0036D8508D
MLRFAALALLLHAVPALAQGEPEDFPEPGAALVDPDFKVGTREFGLDRRVEMYQWRATEGGYERVWHAAPIESAGFAAGHENPPKLLLDNGRWWAEKATLDGKPLDPAVLRTLGEWRMLRPNFSRLPANLAASFQPEGEGLGSAENPLDPQIGDLRVSWRELVLPPLTGKVLLRDGVWRLANDSQDGVPGGGVLPGPAAAPVTPMPDAQRAWPFLAGGLVVIVAIAVAMRRRRRRR